MIDDDARLMIEGYLEYRRAAGDGPVTIRKVNSALGLAGRFVPGPFCAASATDLRRFIGREMTSDGTHRMSDGTRRSYVGIMRGFFAFLVEDGYRDDDPSTRLPKVRVPRGEPRPFVKAEVDRLMDGAYFRTRVMIAIGFYQGYRVSQIAAVRGEDIDLVGRMIRTTGKGGKEAWHPLHPIVAAAALKMPREGYWFPARRGAEGHINGASVSDLVRKARVRAGIVNPKLTAHSLRHGFGTALVENGVDIRIVSELMLHADLSTTQIYTRVSPAMKRAGIDALPGTEIPATSNRARSAVHA